MRILLIGGTSFVGRHIAEAALLAGHEVSLAHRGRTGVDLFPDAEHVALDRDVDLSALAGRDWDATVDVCGYWPRQVRSLAGALAGRGGQHVYISSVSAYAEPSGPEADESTPLASLDAGGDPDTWEMTRETYGPLKALCEQAALQAYGKEHLTIVRPTYVVGPFDPTGRFCWWVDRIARGGQLVCPGPASAALQVIDARDQARWIVDLAATGTSGAFHAVSPPPPWSMADLVAQISTALASTAEPVWAPAGDLLERGLDGADFPLWAAGADEYASALNPAAALSTGLRPRPIGDTVLDTWAWMQEAGWRRNGIGLSPDREVELLRELTG